VTLVSLFSGSVGDCDLGRDAASSAASAAAAWALRLLRGACSVPLRVPAVHDDTDTSSADCPPSLPQRL